jgi:hypothetical protein
MFANRVQEAVSLEVGPCLHLDPCASVLEYFAQRKISNRLGRDDLSVRVTAGKTGNAMSEVIDAIVNA